MPWYCWNRDHLHTTEWEAEACNDLYERWQITRDELFALQDSMTALVPPLTILQQLSERN